jgi:ubiquinol-cytochrome c reductase cytochrome b subunit
VNLEKHQARAWIEDRLPLGRLFSTFLEEHIPGGASWAYVFGSICLALLGVQILTGIALAFFYVPSPDHALTSIHYVASEIPLGRLVLGLHHWSANIFVGVIGLHLLQTFLWGAYKRPRELVWWSGIGLLLLVQAFHFTGFTLPWDQKGYWATEVGTSIAGSVPIMGSYILKLMRGGEELGAVTLTHFYAIHVAILPGIIVALVIAHLVCLRIAGPAGSWDGEETKRTTPPNFYPQQVLKDAVAITLVMVFVFSLAYFAYSAPTTAADPTDTSVLPRPEWNFLFLFQLLRYFPGALEWIGATMVPGVLVALLFLLPFLDWQKERSPFRRRATVTAGFGIIAGIGLLTALAVTSDRAAMAYWLNPTVRAGAQVYVDNDCASCHKIRGEGSGSGGPDLSFIGKTREIEWMKQYIRNPDSLNADTTMPPFKRLSEAELEQLAAYLKSLQ